VNPKLRPIQFSITFVIEVSSADKELVFQLKTEIHVRRLIIVHQARVMSWSKVFPVTIHSLNLIKF